MPKKKKSFLFQKVSRRFTPAKVYRVVLSCCRKKDGVGPGVWEGGGWKRAAVFSINSSGKPPTSPAALPHPQQREVGGGSLRSLFFLQGGIRLAQWLSQLPHNWPRSFLIHPGEHQGCTPKGASPLVWMLTPALMEPQRLQPPPHPPAPESQGNTILPS